MADASDTGLGEGAGGPTRTAYVVAASLAVAGVLWVGADGYAAHAVAVAGIGFLVLLVRAAQVNADGGDEADAGAGEDGDEQSEEESPRDRRDKEMSVGDGHTV